MRRTLLAKIAMLSCLVLLFGGCDYFATKEKPNLEKASPENNKDTDEKVKVLIKTFYTQVFSQPIEVAYKNNVAGTIPTEIDGLVADETKTEKANTPELPIHYPRYTEINGYTCIGYAILTENNEPDIKSGFYEKSADDKYYSYLTEIGLKATVIKNEDFGTFFKYNPQTKNIDKIAELQAGKIDFVKIRARYDVTVLRIGALDYKVKSAVESTAKSGAYRLNKVNNDFITRIPYNNMNNPEDKDKYTVESALAQTYLQQMMTSVDAGRFNVLSGKWAANPNDFVAYMDMLKLLKNDKGDPYLLNPTEPLTYKSRFDIKMFPIKPGISKIISVDEVVVNEHPSFTEKQRNYRIAIKASVEKTEGQIGSTAPYMFEYTVNIQRTPDNKPVINSIKLNQFNMIRQ